MFASLIPELAERAAREGGSVVLECETRLGSLFARSFPTVEVKSSRIETREGIPTARYEWLDNEDGKTAAIELGSLPGFCATTSRAFPDPSLSRAACERSRTVGQGLPAGRAGPLDGILLAQRSFRRRARRAIRATGRLGRFPARAAGDARLRAIRCAEGRDFAARDDERTEDIRSRRSRPEERARSHLRDAFSARCRRERTDRSVVACGRRRRPYRKVLYDTSWTVSASLMSRSHPPARSCRPTRAATGRARSRSPRVGSRRGTNTDKTNRC